MGQVIAMQGWLERRGLANTGPAQLDLGAAFRPPDEGGAEPGAVARLERAVARLEPLLDGPAAHPASGIDLETELLAVSGAVSLGMYDEAARRAERLADRLTARRHRRG